MATYRRDVDRLWAAADDLLACPDLPPWPADHRTPTLHLPHIAWLRGFAAQAGFTAPWTRTTNELYTFSGAVLGWRWLLIAHSASTGDPLPEWFGAAPPRLLAPLAAQAPVLSINAPVFDHPLHDDALPVVEAWETSLGPLALAAFTLSHVIVDGRWAPLTPAMEAHLPK